MREHDRIMRAHARLWLNAQAHSGTTKGFGFSHAGEQRHTTAAEGATGPRKRSGTKDRDRESDLWKEAAYLRSHRRSKDGNHRLNLSGSATEGGQLGGTLPSDDLRVEP
jgi:hypothetical protein